MCLSIYNIILCLFLFESLTIPISYTSQDRKQFLVIFCYLFVNYIHWRRKLQTTPVFLRRESCGQRSLVGCLLSVGSPRGRHDWSDLACMHALEKEMATHPSVLAWRIPGTGEPGRLPSMGLHRVGHNWSDLAEAAARLYMSPCLFNLYAEYTQRRQWHPTPVLLPG